MIQIALIKVKRYDDYIYSRVFLMCFIEMLIGTKLEHTFQIY